MAKKRINWGLVWDAYYEWFDRRSEGKECKHCNHSYSDAPQWEDQMVYIQKQVNKQLKEILNENLER